MRLTMHRVVLATASSLMLLATVGCATRRADTVAPEAGSPAYDQIDIFVRNWPDDIVEFALVRKNGMTTVTLVRPAYDRQPRIVVDSVGPMIAYAPMVASLLDSFDLWAMNAPNAAGAACTTVAGQRNCVITTRDYSLVMQVKRGGKIRVQRYTGLAIRPRSPKARALGDFLLAWARQRETQAP